MVRISKSGNMVEEDIFLICEIISTPIKHWVFFLIFRVYHYYFLTEDKMMYLHN
jgi:hypothetical protein